MIRTKTPGQSAQEVKADYRAPRKRRLVYGLAVLAAVTCGGGGWRCEVTIVMDGQTVVGTGSANAHDVALAEARHAACAQLGLDPLQLRRCEDGANPGAESWSITEDCQES